MPWESPSWSPPRRQWPWRWGGCGWAGSVLLIVRSSRKMIEDKTAQAARLLLDSRNHRRPIEALPEYCRPATTAQAYAIQDAVADLLGPVGGWKVGAKGPDAQDRKSTRLNSSH